MTLEQFHRANLDELFQFIYATAFKFVATNQVFCPEDKYKGG